MKFMSKDKFILLCIPLGWLVYCVAVFYDVISRKENLTTGPIFELLACFVFFFTILISWRPGLQVLLILTFFASVVLAAVVLASLISEKIHVLFWDKVKFSGYSVVLLVFNIFLWRLLYRSKFISKDELIKQSKSKQVSKIVKNEPAPVAKSKTEPAKSVILDLLVVKNDSQAENASLAFEIPEPDRFKTMLAKK